MKEVFSRLVYSFRQNLLRHIIFGFVLLTCIFSGIHSQNILLLPSSFLQGVFLRIIVRLIIFADIFILSLYPFALPLWSLLIMVEACLWGIASKSCYVSVDVPLKFLLFVCLCLSGIFYLLCLILYSEHISDNARRFLPFFGTHLSFSGRLMQSYYELRYAAMIFFISLIELILSCVICCLISA